MLDWMISQDLVFHFILSRNLLLVYFLSILGDNAMEKRSKETFPENKLQDAEDESCLSVFTAEILILSSLSYFWPSSRRMRKKDPDPLLIPFRVKLRINPTPTSKFSDVLQSVILMRVRSQEKPSEAKACFSR